MKEKKKENYKSYRVNYDTKDAILSLQQYYKEDEDIVFTQNQIVELSIKRWYKAFKKKMETF